MKNILARNSVLGIVGWPLIFDWCLFFDYLSCAGASWWVIF